VTGERLHGRLSPKAGRRAAAAETGYDDTMPGTCRASFFPEVEY